MDGIKSFHFILSLSLKISTLRIVFVAKCLKVEHDCYVVMWQYSDSGFSIDNNSGTICHTLSINIPHHGTPTAYWPNPNNITTTSLSLTQFNGLAKANFTWDWELRPAHYCKCQFMTCHWLFRLKSSGWRRRRRRSRPRCWGRPGTWRCCRTPSRSLRGRGRTCKVRWRSSWTGSTRCQTWWTSLG